MILVTDIGDHWITYKIVMVTHDYDYEVNKVQITSSLGTNRSQLGDYCINSILLLHILHTHITHTQQSLIASPKNFT